MKPPSQAVHAQCWNAAITMVDFSYKSLSAKTGLSEATVGCVVRQWETQGVVRRLDGTPRRRIIFAVVNSAKNRPREVIELERSERVESPASNMWLALRGLKTASPQDIAVHATTAKVHITIEMAREFCQRLARAGYCRIVQKAIPGKREAVYKLVRNTGPKPPHEKRLTGLYDPNLDAWAYLPGIRL